MPGPPLPIISRGAPGREIGPRQVHTLPLEQLRPSIRIAHIARMFLEIPPRIIFDHELVLILQGGVLWHDGAQPPRLLRPNDLLVISPFTRHGFRAAPPAPGGRDSDCLHLAVHFDLAPRFPSFAANLPRRPAYEVRFTHGRELPRYLALRPGSPIRRWLEDLVPLFALGDPFSRLRAEALLLQVLITLLDQPSAPSLTATASTRIERSLRLLEQHFTRDLSTGELARAADLSPSHFTRLFRQWTGVAPNEYLLRRRVEEARRLLGESRLTIKEVAARCGFADAYYFSKVFRKLDGLPPTQFREALLANRRGSAANPGRMRADSIE